MMLLIFFVSLAVAMNYDSDGTAATKKYQATISASGALSVEESKLNQEGSSFGSQVVLDEQEAAPTERKFGKNGFEAGWTKEPVTEAAPESVAATEKDYVGFNSTI